MAALAKQKASFELAVQEGFSFRLSSVRFLTFRDVFTEIFFAASLQLL
jgi:hypothetical protein